MGRKEREFNKDTENFKLAFSQGRVIPICVKKSVKPFSETLQCKEAKILRKNMPYLLRPEVDE